MPPVGDGEADETEEERDFEHDELVLLELVVVVVVGLLMLGFCPPFVAEGEANFS